MVDHLRVQRLHREKRNQADHGAHFERQRVPVREMQDVIVKAILAVPKLDALAADIVHGPANINKVLEEFAGHVFIGRVFSGQLKAKAKQFRALHPLPALPSRWSDLSSGGSRRAAFKAAAISKTEKA